MVGHNHVGALADIELVGFNAPVGQLIQFGEQHTRVHHHPIADYSVNVGPADAGGYQVKLKLALIVDHRMAGVVASGVADHTINLPGKVINNLPFSLVSPLSTNHGVGRHPSPFTHKNLAHLLQREADSNGQYNKKETVLKRYASFCQGRLKVTAHA